jgi:hypothetical protein
MSTEERLVAALRAAGRVEPSADLWTRVVHSIDEDRAHRRRIATSTLALAAVVVGLVIVGLANLTDGPAGRQIRIPAMEAIETAALVALVVVLGPAIRRFGRGYAHDLWPAMPDLASSLLRLLDLAYALVFTGFILVTSELDFGTSTDVVATQIQGLCLRVGGLVLIMGLLHASTIMALPVVALISNSTRVGRALPRWLVIVLVVVGAALALQVLPALVGLIGAAS